MESMEKYLLDRGTMKPSNSLSAFHSHSLSHARIYLPLFLPPEKALSRLVLGTLISPGSQRGVCLPASHGDEPQDAPAAPGPWDLVQL